MHDRNKRQFKGQVKAEFKEFCLGVLEEYWEMAESDSSAPRPHNHDKYWRSFDGDVGAAVTDIKHYLATKLPRL